MHIYPPIPASVFLPSAGRLLWYPQWYSTPTDAIRQPETNSTLTQRGSQVRPNELQLGLRVLGLADTATI